MFEASHVTSYYIMSLNLGSLSGSTENSTPREVILCQIKKKIPWMCCAADGVLLFFLTGSDVLFWQDMLCWTGSAMLCGAGHAVVCWAVKAVLSGQEA